MKYILLSILLFCSAVSAEENYLKFRSYPSYPVPGAITPQTVEIKFRPSFPKDEKFEELNGLLKKISSFEGHDVIALHTGNISLEFSWHGKVISTAYSKNPANSSPDLAQHWKEVFILLQSMVNQQLKL